MKIDREALFQLMKKQEPYGQFERLGTDVLLRMETQAREILQFIQSGGEFELVRREDVNN